MKILSFLCCSLPAHLPFTETACLTPERQRLQSHITLARFALFTPLNLNQQHTGSQQNMYISSSLFNHFQVYKGEQSWTDTGSVFPGEPAL